MKAIKQKDFILFGAGAILGGFIAYNFRVQIQKLLPSETPQQRAGSGTLDGGGAATLDKTKNVYNPACDPTGVHTDDGQHSTEYCNAWTAAYLQVYPR
jgi:hypothetical protein